MADRAVYVVTGPSAAGKSTAGRLLAARFERGVCLEGDVFRRSIVSGRHEMTPEQTPEALAQLRLRYRLTAAVADAYFDDGFTVVVEDVVAGPLLAEFAELLRSRPLHVVVLLPTAETLASREEAREENGYHSWSIAALHAGFAEETPRLGLWLDTSKQTPEETVSEILARTAQSLVAA
jgi:chloramphenicol 3-O-phosphotransferase